LLAIDKFLMDPRFDTTRSTMMSALLKGVLVAGAASASVLRSSASFNKRVGVLDV
jgi:hypothetical protein